MAKNKYARKKRLEEDEYKEESNPYINTEDDDNEDEFVEEPDENEEELKSIAAEADIDDASHSENDEEANDIEDDDDTNAEDEDEEEILATDTDDDDKPQSKRTAKLKTSLAKNAILRERKRCLKLTHIGKVASRMGVSFNVKQAVANGLSVQNAAKAVMRAARENRESYTLVNIPPQRSDRFASSYQSVSASKINNMWAKAKGKK